MSISLPFHCFKLHVQSFVIRLHRVHDISTTSFPFLNHLMDVCNFNIDFVVTVNAGYPNVAISKIV